MFLYVKFGHFIENQVILNYTSTNDHKKIITGGWCGWKKAFDNKGKNVFLHDKFDIHPG